MTLKAVVCSFIVTCLTMPSISAAEPSIVGVWLGTQVEVVGGDNAGITQVTNPRFLMYTAGGHYMLNFELRDREPGNSDRAIADANRGYSSWGGTYMLDGTDIIYIRRISNNPTLMLPENQRAVRQLRAVTDTMLETYTTNDEGVTTIFRYRRIE